MAPRPDNSLARSLGQFFGHIWKGVRADVSGDTREVGRSTRQTTTTDPHGHQVTLRRTTIDEIEIHPRSNNPQENHHAPR